MEQIFKWVSSSSGGQFRQFFNSENSGSDNFMGGVANTVSGAYSAVLGGSGNTVSGYCSAVLNGSGNTVTHNWASASGYNVASSCDCAFHANVLIAPNSPIFITPTSRPTGTLQYAVAPAVLGFPLGTCMVLIS